MNLVNTVLAIPSKMTDTSDLMAYYVNHIQLLIVIFICLTGAMRDLTGSYRMAFYIFGSTYILGACFFLPVLVLEKGNKMCEQVLNIEHKETSV